MDKLDRMLHDLPGEPAPAGLAADLTRGVLRRHRWRRRIREAGASLLGLAGVWLLWPGIAWLSGNQLLASSAPWLAGGLSLLDYESAEAMSRLWSGALSVQDTLASTLAVSVLLGALLVCCAIFLAVDPASWRTLPAPAGPVGRSTGLPSGLHP